MKQQFLLRNTNIRANAINAINQLQIDEKRPVVIEIKEMTRPLIRTLSFGQFWATSAARLNGMGESSHPNHGSISSPPHWLSRR